jgi:hypothetical protein
VVSATISSRRGAVKPCLRPLFGGVRAKMPIFTSAAGLVPLRSGHAMKALRRLLGFAFAAIVLSACTTGQFSRNVYEGAAAHNESLKPTPLGNPRAESVGYDQYEQERQSGAAGRSK